MERIINVREAGAMGNGIQDDYPFIQRALDEAANAVVFIPEGTYRITETLKVSSNTEIRADQNAHLFHCGSKPKHHGDFLLSNKNVTDGDENITVIGGVWDGNYDGKNNNKHPDLFAEDAWSGAMFNFQNVKNLHLEDLTLENSVVYYVRMGGVDGFHIENIRFRAKQLAFNQDGLHFHGGCRNGVVKNIVAYDNETNDDFIALNADDSTARLENRDLYMGDIENITFENIRAENCYTFVRMASVTSRIRNITMKNIYCGCRMYAVNMDALRYCKTPLFKEEEYPNGCGAIENIKIENMRVFSTAKDSIQPLICAESLCKNFRIEGFERVLSKDVHPDANPTIQARNLTNTQITVAHNGKTSVYPLRYKQDSIQLYGTFDSIQIESK